MTKECLNLKFANIKIPTSNNFVECAGSRGNGLQDCHGSL